MSAVYWDRAATVITVILAVVVTVTLALLSHLNYGVLTLLGSLFLPYVLGFIWLVLVAFSIKDRRVRAPLLAAPLLIALLVVAPYTDFPSKARLALSRGGMDAYARALPPPPPRLTRELTDGELESYDTTFAQPCPWLLGSYRIVECRAIPGGYVFLTSVSEGGEGAGLAYLPDGPPDHSLSPDILQEPIFEPIGGAWYRLILSW